VKLSGAGVSIVALAGCMNSDDNGENSDGENDGTDTNGDEQEDPQGTPELTELRDIYNNRVWTPAEQTIDAFRQTISAYEERRFDAALESKSQAVRELSELTQALTNETLNEEMSEEQFTAMSEGIIQLRDANTELDKAESFRQDDEAAKYEQSIVKAEEYISLAQDTLPEPEEL